MFGVFKELVVRPHNIPTVMCEESSFSRSLLAFGVVPIFIMLTVVKVV